MCELRTHAALALLSVTGALAPGWPEAVQPVASGGATGRLQGGTAGPRRPQLRSGAQRAVLHEYVGPRAAGGQLCRCQVAGCDEPDHAVVRPQRRSSLQSLRTACVTPRRTCVHAHAHVAAASIHVAAACITPRRTHLRMKCTCSAHAVRTQCARTAVCVRMHLRWERALVKHHAPHLATRRAHPRRVLLVAR